MSLTPAAQTELVIPAMCNRIRGLKEWSEIPRSLTLAPRHLSGLADAKVEQHCHRYGHYDEH